MINLLNYFSIISIQWHPCTDEPKKKATNYCIRFLVTRYGPQSVASAQVVKNELRSMAFRNDVKINFIVRAKVSTYFEQSPSAMKTGVYWNEFLQKNICLLSRYSSKFLEIYGYWWTFTIQKKKKKWKNDWLEQTSQKIDSEKLL